MNESEMTELLEQATGSLQPDVGRLVAAGVRGGRGRRRRTAVAVLATTAVVAVAGGGVAVATMADGGSSSHPAPASNGVSNGAAAGPDGVQHRRRFLVPPSVARSHWRAYVQPSVSSRLHRLLPGATHLADRGTRSIEVGSGSVDWRGLHVDVRFTYRHPASRAHPWAPQPWSTTSRHLNVYRCGDGRGDGVVLRLSGARTGNLRGALTNLPASDRWVRISCSPLWR